MNEHIQARRQTLARAIAHDAMELDPIGEDYQLVKSLAVRLDINEAEVMHRALVLLDASEQRATHIRMSGGREAVVTSPPDTEPDEPIGWPGWLFGILLGVGGSAGLVLAVWLLGLTIGR